MATNAEEFAVFHARVIDAVDSYRRSKDITTFESEYVLEGHAVVDFSSQYGSESSLLSYVASNLAGKTCIFPSYGDYTQACVFRTYGYWWQIAPSSVLKYRGTPSRFSSQDYIEVSFSKCIYPERIEIFETYNPGAIVRILACGTDTDEGKIQWVTLWEDKPKPHCQKPNMFSPPLKQINFATNLIRLELNHDFMDYYTELDGIKLYGSSTPPSFIADDICNLPDSVSEKGSKSKTKTMDELTDDFENVLHVDAIYEYNDDEDENFFDGVRESHFSILPKEIIHLIITYLNTSDLCRLAQTCRCFRDHCYDPLLYTELNLQPYWTQVLNSTFAAISSRCSRLQRLNLSWCGKGGHIYSEVLEEFLQKHNENLQSIEFAACPFMDANALTMVIATCSNLTELNLASCIKIDDFSIFQIIPLKDLRRLNLYRTKIDAKSVASVFRSNTNLEHLNIGSCVQLNPSMEFVLMELGLNCKKLRTLDLWRLKSVNAIGLSHLYNGCPLLEELDVGWCVDLYSETKCFTNLAQKCKHLKKLFLTANRTIRNRDLKAIADFCPNLEQLDILGTREVSKSAIAYILETCKSLKFLDVSFCVGIIFADVWAWRATYPHVAIKKSFQNISAS